jgi:hypothetical protein
VPHERRRPTELARASRDWLLLLCRACGLSNGIPSSPNFHSLKSFLECLPPQASSNDYTISNIALPSRDLISRLSHTPANTLILRS